MPGWGKLIAGVVLGAAGALYATNEEFRKALPARTRDLPSAVQRRFEAAAAAAREASVSRRAEILRELEAHGGTRLSAKDSESAISGVAEETMVARIEDVKK
ncbi:MAG: hypothetical protein JOZ19_17410 [Rubrobacter sp.]|nr:hypothetical protein [Rubrobacter sp.]